MKIYTAEVLQESDCWGAPITFTLGAYSTQAKAMESLDEFMALPVSILDGYLYAYVEEDGSVGMLPDWAIEVWAYELDDALSEEDCGRFPGLRVAYRGSDEPSESWLVLDEDSHAYVPLPTAVAS